MRLSERGRKKMMMEREKGTERERRQRERAGKKKRNTTRDRTPTHRDIIFGVDVMTSGKELDSPAHDVQAGRESEAWSTRRQSCARTKCSFDFFVRDSMTL